MTNLAATTTFVITRAEHPEIWCAVQWLMSRPAEAPPPDIGALVDDLADLAASLFVAALVRRRGPT